MGALDWIKHKSNQTCRLLFVTMEGSPWQQQRLPFTLHNETNLSAKVVEGCNLKASYSINDTWQECFFDPFSLLSPLTEVKALTFILSPVSATGQSVRSNSHREQRTSLQETNLATCRHEEKRGRHNISFNFGSQRNSCPNASSGEDKDVFFFNQKMLSKIYIYC